MVSQRPGAFSIYLEPWHPDIFDFLDLRKNHGSEEKVHSCWCSPIYSTAVSILYPKYCGILLYCCQPLTRMLLLVAWLKGVPTIELIFYISLHRERGICFMHCGYQISSCVVSSPMGSGHWCAPTSVPGWLIAGGRSLSNSMCSTRKRGRPRKWWRHRSCGLPYLRLRLRQALHTCCTRTPATGRATSRCCNWTDLYGQKYMQ